MTRDLLLEAIRRRPLVLNRCSICGYECSYQFRGDIFGYDHGCHCLTDGFVPRSPEVLDFYLDPERGWTDRLERFVRESFI